MSVLLAVGVAILASVLAFALLYAAHYVISVREHDPMTDCEDRQSKRVTPLERERTRVRAGKRNGDLRRLMPQVIGYLASVGAVLGLHDTASVLGAVRALVSDVRKDPSKYLRVQLKVF